MAGIGELVDGKYEILSLVGEGGMSRVYLARDRRLNKLWAVKEINRAADGPGGAVVSQSLVAEANLLKYEGHREAHSAGLSVPRCYVVGTRGRAWLTARWCRRSPRRRP